MTHTLDTAGRISDLDTAPLSAPASATQARTDNKTEMFGTFRGRVGYIWNNWLFFGTGGFAWANTHVTRTQLLGTSGGAAPGSVDSIFATTTGWAAGVGLEWAFAQSWTARLEYQHLDVGPQSLNFTSAGFRRDADTTIDTVRVALNYRFNWMGR